MTETTATMRTADNQTIGVGEKAYDFYADKLDDTAVVVFSHVDGTEGSAVWGVWTHEDGTGMILRDGGRVCSMGHANTMGWLSTATYNTHLVSLEVK